MLPLICIALTHHFALPRASFHSHVRGRAPTACAALAERRSFEFQGYETSYISAGGLVTADVPPVVLVHGFGASSAQWRATISDLAAAGHAVYALDLLAFGSSAKPRTAYSIDLWADQLLHFIAEVVVSRDGAQSAVVVGNSIGSLTCALHTPPRLGEGWRRAWRANGQAPGPSRDQVAPPRQRQAPLEIDSWRPRPASGQHLTA
jgi:hypothetical protein